MVTAYFISCPFYMNSFVSKSHRIYIYMCVCSVVNCGQGAAQSLTSFAQIHQLHSAVNIWDRYALYSVCVSGLLHHHFCLELS